MEKTLLRVRGKRRPRGQKATPIGANRAFKASLARKARLAKDGPGGLDKKPMIVLSRLESLPVELLEQIFHHAQTVDLPLASLELGRKLSSSRSKYDFFDNVVCSHPRSGNLPESDFKTKSRVLRLRWFTFAFFSAWLAQKKTEAEKLGFLKVPQSTKAKNSRFYELDYFPRDLIDLSRVYVPRKLLHGPWNTDKVSLLEELLRLGAKIDNFDSTDAELADASLLDAIRTSNVQLVEALVSRLIRVQVASHRRLRLASGIKPQTTHLLTAVQPQNFNTAITNCLLEATVSAIDTTDASIWAQINELKLHDRESYEWVKQAIMEIREVQIYYGEIDFQAEDLQSPENRHRYKRTAYLDALYDDIKVE